MDNISGSVLVLDFGSQYTQLITRRIRELGVFSEIMPCYKDPKEVDFSKVKALILSGGPASVGGDDAPDFDSSWLDHNLPTLGICYGMQLLSLHHGGTLGQGTSREYGRAQVHVHRIDSLFQSFEVDESTCVWMSHGDHVEVAPSGFEVLASSKGAPVAAIGNRDKKLYGLQFHPEVVHTERGKDMLSNFLFKIAEITPDWSPANFIETSIENIRGMVPEGSQVICGLSGGVDSSVAAVLVNKAIGQNLHCIFVDNGLLRKDEVEEVVSKLGPDGLGLNIHVARAADRFLTALSGETDPEKKRKIIGHTFIEVFDEEAKRISNVSHLVQGTLYPDVVESVSSFGGPSTTIKTHHNVGGLPETMQLELIEPFRELFKDEVRQVGRDLGIPEAILMRHPFPGPGLAVRILGDITEERLHLLRESDAIFRHEIQEAGIYDDIWQAFAVLLPIKSVGVMGDGRTYEQVIALRAVTSQDGMTADWFDFPHEVLSKVSNRIINEVKGINRVVLDISSKPPATIEWE